jgi:hypothetical protein
MLQYRRLRIEDEQLHNHALDLGGNADLSSTLILSYEPDIDICYCWEYLQLT